MYKNQGFLCKNAFDAKMHFCKHFVNKMFSVHFAKHFALQNAPKVAKCSA